MVRISKCPWAKKFVKNNCSLFFPNATSQNHCISNYLYYFPSHSQFNAVLPDFHPHWSTKINVFHAIKWKEYCLVLISLDISSAFDTSGHFFLKPCWSIRLHGLQKLWLSFYSSSMFLEDSFFFSHSISSILGSLTSVFCLLWWTHQHP